MDIELQYILHSNNILMLGNLTNLRLTHGTPLPEAEGTSQDRGAQLAPGRKRSNNTRSRGFSLLSLVH